MGEATWIKAGALWISGKDKDEFFVSGSVILEGHHTKVSGHLSRNVSHLQNISGNRDVFTFEHFISRKCTEYWAGDVCGFKMFIFFNKYKNTEKAPDFTVTYIEHESDVPYTVPPYTNNNLAPKKEEDKKVHLHDSWNQAAQDNMASPLLKEISRRLEESNSVESRMELPGFCCPLGLKKWPVSEDEVFWKLTEAVYKIGQETQGRCSLTEDGPKRIKPIITALRSYRKAVKALAEMKGEKQMELDWKELSDLGEGIGKDFLEVVKPYLPVLARSGHEVFEGFIAHLTNKDFTAIDKELYALMSPEERLKLEQVVYSDAYKAALAKFERIELFKEIALKLVIRLAIKVATGGVL